MTNSTQKNELIKHRYLTYCRDGDGFAESTINKYAQCIYKWQTCFDDADFVLFDRTHCEVFKKYLKDDAIKKNTSLSNQYDILRHLKKFFLWLEDQDGYGTIKKSDLIYLRLSKKEIKHVLERKEKDIPSLDDIKLIVSNIQGETEVAQRDRALVAFLILTGMRISAVASLPMEAFDPHTFTIEQSVRLGVKTKNDKLILSTFLPIDWDEGEKIFLDWYSFLQSEKEFGPRKPIFPATKSFSQIRVSDEFWKSSAPARKIIYDRCKRANLQNFNPHSFRHAVVAHMSERGLTEADKRSISLVLGHENIGTTFGSYGYGSITPRDAVKRVRNMKSQKRSNFNLPQSDEELGRKFREVLGK